MKKNIAFALTILFGVFYLFSGIIKIVDIDDFLFLIRSYRIQSFLYLALAIPTTEILIGIMLILQIRVKEIVLFSFLMLIGFTIVFSYGNFFLSIDDCGCFGSIDFLKMSPVIFFIRNGLLLVVTYYLYNSIEKGKKEIQFYQIILLIFIVISSSLAVGVRSNLSSYLKKSPYTRSTIDNYHDSLLNKNINETILSKYISTTKDSSYIVFIFSYKCPHCIVSSHYLNEYIDSNVVDKVLGITKGTRKEERFFSRNFKTKFDYKRIKFIEMNEITAFYPLSFYIENDTIRFKIKGNLPKYDKFQELYLNESAQNRELK